MNQVIGYVRRSDSNQEESLEQQRTKLKEFAEKRGWRIIQVFEDDAITGSDLSREGLRAMVSRVQQDGGIDGVLIWDRNRLARPKDPLEGLLLEREILLAGKEIFYAASGTEVKRSFLSDLTALIEHHQNGDYLRKLSRDSMRGTTSRAQHGFWPGGPIPFGYDRLIVSPDQASVSCFDGPACRSSRRCLR